ASRWVRSESFGPFPFELSRDRVTDENAEVTFLDAKHPLLNSPNKITKADFEDWVQERGLYFATNWADEYKPLLSWHDKGAVPVKGGLIVAKYGKGQFIYTGISFFRELPNGVSGAFKLFANLLSYEP
ncbi:MAG: LmbE family protein, partial [Crocinitomicaceae bacterium]